ncbi:MAG: hypothetical protein HPM95_19505 [Alphaproteobacteria bacterium]|nr:hypothetical protein [Alphaproteobacteria bacterium]
MRRRASCLPGISHRRSRFGSKTLSVIVYEVPTAGIGTVLADYAGLGETGDINLVNEAGLLQNDSLRVGGQRASVRRSRPPRGARRSGRTPLCHDGGLQGTDVEAAIVPLSFLGKSYALVVSQTTDELFAPLASLRNWILIITLAAVGVALTVGIHFSRALTVRISRLSGAMEGLAGSGAEVDLPRTKEADEIDAMTRSVVVFRDNAIERQALAEEQNAGRRETEERAAGVATDQALPRRGRRDARCRDRQRRADAGHRRALTAVAERASGGANTAAAAAKQTSGNVQTVASAAEELAASIRRSAVRCQCDRDRRRRGHQCGSTNARSADWPRRHSASATW